MARGISAPSRCSASDRNASCCNVNHLSSVNAHRSTLTMPSRALPQRDGTGPRVRVCPHTFDPVRVRISSPCEPQPPHPPRHLRTPQPPHRQVQPRRQARLHTPSFGSLAPAEYRLHLKPRVMPRSRPHRPELGNCLAAHTQLHALLHSIGAPFKDGANDVRRSALGPAPSAPLGARVGSQAAPARHVRNERQASRSRG